MEDEAGRLRVTEALLRTGAAGRSAPTAPAAGSAAPTGPAAGSPAPVPAADGTGSPGVDASTAAGSPAPAANLMKDVPMDVGPANPVTSPGAPATAGVSRRAETGPEGEPSAARARRGVDVDEDAAMGPDTSQVLGELSVVLSSFGFCRTGVSEVFGRGRFTSRVSAFDLPPGTAMDIRTGYEFSIEGDRERTMITLRAEKQH